MTIPGQAEQGEAQGIAHQIEEVFASRFMQGSNQGFGGGGGGGHRDGIGRGEQFDAGTGIKAWGKFINCPWMDANPP
jgi:hypothetical protein